MDIGIFQELLEVHELDSKVSSLMVQDPRQAFSMCASIPAGNERAV